MSSTVIPLYSYHVNATGAFKHHALSLDDEYRIAYLKHMHKKHKEAADDPDTLITRKAFIWCFWENALFFCNIVFMILFAVTKKYHPGKKIKTESQQAAVVNAA